MSLGTLFAATLGPMPESDESEGAAGSKPEVLRPWSRDEGWGLGFRGI